MVQVFRLNDVRTSTPRQPGRKVNVILPKDHCEVLPVLFSSYSGILHNLRNDLRRFYPFSFNESRGSNYT